MNKRRILTSYYQPKPGGCCKRLFRAINALLKEQHEVHYLSVVPFPINEKNCHFHRFYWPEKYTDNYIFWAWFHMLAPFQLLIIGFSKQITHSFSFNATYSLVMKPLCLLMNIPHVLFIRGDKIQSHQLNNRNKILIWIEVLLEGLAISGIIVYGNSKYITNTTLNRHRYLRPKYHSIIRNDISFASPPEVIKNHHHFHISCAGTLDKNKNQQFLLYTIKQLKNNNYTFYIYGSGKDESFLKHRTIELGLNDRVRFMGWVDSEKIWENSDLILSASLSEGSPNIVLEAIAHRVPVLASNIPSHSEILPDSCLFDLDNFETLAMTVDILIENKDKLSSLLDDQLETLAKLDFEWDKKIVSFISNPSDHE